MGAAAPRSPVTAIPLGKGSTGLQEKVGELTKVTTLGISWEFQVKVVIWNSIGPGLLKLRCILNQGVCLCRVRTKALQV
jgi:hypothetical protein